MSYSTLTAAQKRFHHYFQVGMPPKPMRVSDRNWRMTVDHIQHRIGFASLGVKYPDETTGKPLTRSRTSQIVNRSLDWAIKEEEARTANNG
jgi:hypothetical protein